MFYMHGIGWGWWLLMSIGMVAFWALIIYGVLWLVRGDRLSEPREGSHESPEAILKRRLAQGEISIEQYQRLRDTIEQPPPPHEMAA